MIEATTTIFAATIIIAMATLGAVLLVRFFMTKADTATRTVTAALLGPLLVLLPFFIVLIITEGDGIAGLIGISVIVLLLFVFIGYPVSHFATRRLDKLTEFTADIFE